MKNSVSLRNLIGFLLISLVILVTLGIGPASARPETAAPRSLVRVDVNAPADRQLAASAVPVMAQLWDADGQEYLLVEAGAGQQAALAKQGLALRVLDADSGGEAYYLLSARRPDALTAARQIVTVLAEDGSTVIIRAHPAQADQLAALGVEIRRLGPRPMILNPPSEVLSFPEIITPDPLIQGMINQVSAATVWDYDGNLSGVNQVIIGGSPYTIQNRNTNGGTPIQKATQYMYEHFTALGLDASYHQWSAVTNPNVIGEQPGIGQPERIFLITAHLDDMPTGSIAPGADDNASGSVGVMIAADILSQYNFDCTLRYVLFTGEEQGLLGSAAYAQHANSLGEDIEGVLNLDMIAYNSDSSPILDLHTRSGSAGVPDLAIANLFIDVVDAYDINLTPQIFQDNIQYSDHASFWDYGYPAILGIEDDDDFTPFYHTTNDTRATLNQTYFTNFVKASVGTFAHMGCLLPPSGHLAGQVTDAASGEPLAGAAVAAALGPNQSWDTLSLADGSYDLALVPGVYDISAVAPGHMVYTTTGIVIQEGVTTTLDIALEITPTLTITGYVREAYSGVPLAATVSILGSSIPPTQTNPATGFYTFHIFAGHYTLKADAEHYISASQTIDLSSDSRLDFDLTPTCLLVIDDDGGAAYDDYYTDALENLGYSYEMNTTLPESEMIAQYQGVIWLTGDAVTNTLTPADQSALAEYLDAGGRLFVSGQDIGADIGGTDFYHNYLHANLVANNTNLFWLNGQSFLGLPLVDIFLQGLGGANNQTSPDGVTPVNGGYSVYQYNAGPFGGIAYDGVYRAVYFSFGYESINRQFDRDNVMEAVLDHLGVCSVPQAPQASFTHADPDPANTVQFTNTSRGAAWMSYTWNFGDGSAGSTQANPTHAFGEPGTYTVTLTAVSRYGMDTFASAIVIPEKVCVPTSGIDFSFAPSDVIEGEIVTFTLDITGGTEPITVTWDFGDGSDPVSGVGLTVITHIFSVTSSEQTFTVTATADNGCSTRTQEKSIRVQWQPPYEVYLPVVCKPISGRR